VPLGGPWHDSLKRRGRNELQAAGAFRPYFGNAADQREFWRAVWLPAGFRCGWRCAATNGAAASVAKRQVGRRVGDVRVLRRRKEPTLWYSHGRSIRSNFQRESLAQTQTGIARCGTVTDGKRPSQQNDAAAACLVVDEDNLAALRFSLSLLVDWGPPAAVIQRRWASAPTLGLQVLARTGLIAWPQMESGWSSTRHFGSSDRRIERMGNGRTTTD